MLLTAEFTGGLLGQDSATYVGVYHGTVVFDENGDVGVDPVVFCIEVGVAVWSVEGVFEPVEDFSLHFNYCVFHFKRLEARYGIFHL